MSMNDLEDRIVAAVASIGPSVASVESLRVGRRRGRELFASPGQATAVVWDRAGYLLTNQHVVDGATALRVHLADGRDLPGEVVGGDAVTDLAVVRVDGIDVTAARIGDSDSLRVGQIVLAVGHALGLPGGPTVSTGVVSALGRPLLGSDFIFEGLVQTDAAINPGNSGGPLLDLSGSVIGINTAMIPFAQGVGFAIPAQAVRRIAQELRERGRVIRPWVGVRVAELGPELARAHGLSPGTGLLIAEVVPRSPAHRAGLRAGDVVSRVGPFEVRRVRELIESLTKFPVGSDVRVSLRRRGREFEANVPLEEAPPTAEIGS
jgi:serine protease Do